MESKLLGFFSSLSRQPNFYICLFKKRVPDGKQEGRGHVQRGPQMSEHQGQHLLGLQATQTAFRQLRRAQKYSRNTSPATFKRLPAHTSALRSHIVRDVF